MTPVLSDQVILAPSTCESRKMVIEINVAVKERGMNESTYWMESGVRREKNESEMNAVQARSVRSACRVPLKDRRRDSDVRERCGLKQDVVNKVEEGMLLWIGQLERMNESTLKNFKHRKPKSLNETLD
ncbi:hypothetical protein EVAR_36369_1 [Eumeta japonica]|uniref:Uncharacterized protein n=1 Tax=Eumeta variegata TaxID=151549 RepID=A0A4C1W780_EUMVA|nr:hypothetical protein EVAR_36369_1 [Eumeta japonica]